jgi:hypothetical protein
VLSYCEYYGDARYVCVDKKLCIERQAHPLVIRAKELGIKLTYCKFKGCKELVGYANFSNIDKAKVIRQAVCKGHQTGLSGYYSKKPIPHGTEQGYRKGCKDFCCLAAHAEKLRGDRNIAGSLKVIPDAHEVEGILTKMRDPDYVPMRADFYAVQVFLQRFPQFFIKPKDET